MDEFSQSLRDGGPTLVAAVLALLGVMGNLIYQWRRDAAAVTRDEAQRAKALELEAQQAADTERILNRQRNDARRLLYSEPKRDTYAELLQCLGALRRALNDMQEGITPGTDAERQLQNDLDRSRRLNSVTELYDNEVSQLVTSMLTTYEPTMMRYFKTSGTSTIASNQHDEFLKDYEALRAAMRRSLQIDVPTT